MTEPKTTSSTHDTKALVEEALAERPSGPAGQPSEAEHDSIH